MSSSKTFAFWSVAMSSSAPVMEMLAIGCALRLGDEGDLRAAGLLVVGLHVDGGDVASGPQRGLDALQAAGYIVTVDMETYDKETGRTQIALVAETEGAEYG